MTVRNSRPWRSLAVFGLLAGLFGLLAAGPSALAVHFFADFNQQGEGSHDFHAKVGQLESVSGASVFSLAFDGPDDGVLRVGPNTTAEPARMHAALASPTTGTLTVVSFRITPLGDYGDAFITLAEENDSGMIDISFTPDGRVRAGGEARPLPGLPGDTFDVVVQLIDPLLGASSFQLTVDGPLGSVAIDGPLDEVHVDLAAVDIVRPAGAVGNVFEIDDLLVTSLLPKSLKLFAEALDLTP